jgi:hypothetical protein
LNSSSQEQLRLFGQLSRVNVPLILNQADSALEFMLGADEYQRDSRVLLSRLARRTGTYRNFLPGPSGTSTQARRDYKHLDVFLMLCLTIKPIAFGLH